MQYTRQLSCKQQQGVFKYKRVSRELEQTLGRTFTVSEMVKKLGILESK